MPYDYSSMLALVNDKIPYFGKNVTLRTITAGTLNPVTDVITGRTTTDTTVSIVIIPANAQQINGTSVLSGDATAYLSGDYTVNIYSQIIDVSTTWNIVPPLQTIDPSGVELLHVLQLRK
jgi:hypothetical protein